MSKAPISDFADWLQPMLVKELRQGLKARAFVYTFSGLQILLVMLTIYHTLSYAKDPQSFTGSDMGAFFWVLVGVQLFAVTPLRAVGALAGERKANTLELIFMTGLTPWKIAFGKWVSLMFQAGLFLLAVMPYAILRYFFGGMDLTDELLSLLGAMLGCGVLSAVALAISGLPLPVRIAACGLAVFMSTGFVPMIVFGVMMAGGGMGGGPFGGSGGVGFASWLPVMIYDSILLILLGIEVASATIAPPAENHAAHQRILALFTWLPVPFLFMLNPGVELASTQTIFAIVICAIVSWAHLGGRDKLMRIHLEPFAKLGKSGRFLGLLLLPGLPGAVVFLVLCEILAASSASVMGSSGSWNGFGAWVLMAGAALMTAPFLWRLFGRRPKWPLAEYSVVLIFSGAIPGFLSLIIPIETLRDEFLLGIFPPVAVWLMNADGPSGPLWWAVSLAMFSLLACGLMALSRDYWRRAAMLAAEIRNAVPKRKPLPVAA